MERKCTFFGFFSVPPGRQIHCACLETKMLRIAKPNKCLPIHKFVFPILKPKFGKIYKQQNVCNLANPIFLRARVVVEKGL
jgi:hypothetical protein